MADVDIDSFGNRDKTDSHPDEKSETIPFTPGGMIGGSTWEPECEQETSFRGRTSLSTEVLREHIKALCHVLSKSLWQTPEAFHFDDFKLIGRKLYHRDKNESLTIGGGGGGGGEAKVIW